MAVFTNEEGVRYSPGMLGSAVYTGGLSVEQAQELRGFDGSIFGDELERIGYAGSMQPGIIRPYAFLELHIEQGPVLDQANIPLGVVETVTGITWLEVTVTGAANHAGTTPLDQRRDAGLAAAKMVAALREIATTIGGEQRATCGMITFEPNAINVIPGKAVFTVDLRNSDSEALVQAEKLLYTQRQGGGSQRWREYLYPRFGARPAGEIRSSDCRCSSNKPPTAWASPTGAWFQAPGMMRS